MTAPRSSRVLVYGALMTQTLISAGTYLAAKRALIELSPSALAMMRFAGASLCFALLVVAFVRPPLPPKVWWWRIVGLGILGVPLNQGLFLTGLGQSTAAHASLLYTLTPLFVFLLALFAGTERPTPAKIAGLAIALGGAGIVVFERSGGGFSGGSAYGDLLILGAVVAWASYTVMGKPLVNAHGPIAATAWSLIAGTVVFAPLGVPSTAAVQFSRITTPVWFALVFLILLTSVVSYLCWYYALRELEPSRVAIFSNLQPVATALASWLLFGEAITSRLLLGGVLVICGVLVTTQAATWRSRSSQPALD